MWSPLSIKCVGGGRNLRARERDIDHWADRPGRVHEARPWLFDGACHPAALSWAAGASAKHEARRGHALAAAAVKSRDRRLGAFEEGDLRDTTLDQPPLRQLFRLR